MDPREWDNLCPSKGSVTHSAFNSGNEESRVEEADVTSLDEEPRQRRCATGAILPVWGGCFES
jgi:hypothetical protein